MIGPTNDERAAPKNFSLFSFFSSHLFSKCFVYLFFADVYQMMRRENDGGTPLPTRVAVIVVEQSFVSISWFVFSSMRL